MADYTSDVAVIGISARFPQAQDYRQYWENLCAGLECTSEITAEESLRDGADPEMLRHPHYVNRSAILDTAEQFDADFFGLTPREASVLDPQHRLLLECAWESLEDAGHTPEGFDGPVGVFTGCSASNYKEWLLVHHAELDMPSPYVLNMATGPEFAATRISYKLNLTGPSLSVQTACSTSLVALHLATQSLLSGECDMALVGAASIQVPQRVGYIYEDGGIASPDGHCRPFDAAARGTFPGSGAGVVALRRLGDAQQDGDQIRAVIKASAINNDGSAKLGYTAPSVDRQAAVVAEALAMADVHPDSVTYVEAHGTGTPLGDPIEVAALAQAFSARTSRRGYCALGSVKGNIGHLDVAAGMAGLIKAILAVEEGLLPPTLHFATPNPQIDFDRTPFYVSPDLEEWRPEAAPRRAGVSSFGVGGTNAHVILEQAPGRPAASASGGWQLIPVSARTATALQSAADRMTAHLRDHGDSSLADIAYTCQVGRRAFGHRQALVRQEAADGSAPRTLAAPGPPGQSPDQPPAGVAFLFPGQGTDLLGAGADLYEQEPVFRDVLSTCAARLAGLIGLDIRRVLYPPDGERDRASQLIRRPEVTQPLLFAVEYAIAQLWSEWGVRPDVLAGHSLGEYTAACWAGIFSLEQCLDLLVERGRLVASLPAGRMLSVRLPEQQVISYLGADVDLAASNAPESCVLAGTAEAIAEVTRDLRERGIRHTLLPVDRAFHSRLTDPILSKFGEVVRGHEPGVPSLPVISNVTGEALTAEQAASPDYWMLHLRSTVRFAQCLDQLAGYFLVEAGPGRTLSALARQQGFAVAVPSLPEPSRPGDGMSSMLSALGQLWTAGVEPDWARLRGDAPRRRVCLPTYPFERKYHRIELRSQPGQPAAASAPAAQPPPAGPPAGMTARNDAGAPADGRDAVLSELRSLVARFLGVGPADFDTRTTLFELGFSSFSIIEVNEEINRCFPVEMPLRRLYEDLSTVELLAEYIANQGETRKGSGT